MATPTLSLAGAYIELVADHLASMGVDVRSWLGTYGLTEAVVSEANLSLPVETWGRLLLDARTLAREPALGLFIGERLVVRTHGFLGYAAMSSRTVLDMVDVLERFTTTRISGVALRREMAGDELQLRLEELIALGPIRPFLFEAVALSLKNILAAVTMGACPIASAYFLEPEPEYADLARDILGCEVHYGSAWAGVSIPRVKAELRLKMADPHAFQEAAEICQRQLDELERKQTMATRVERLLLESRHGFPPLASTARRLHLTPRTLHRRLEQEGTSYRALLDGVRFRLACEYLARGGTRVEEIAYMLGYSDPSNFRRAFKRWAKVTPLAYREARL
ncbi:MAG: AraC family transcriptional regulator ligand-binding domain-containing protein [Myxococcota bacterium]